MPDGCLFDRGERTAESFSSVDEQLPAIGCCSSTSRTVGECSMGRRKRNHEARGIFRALDAGTSLRSRAITPKPLLCRRRSVTLSSWASWDCQRLKSDLFFVICRPDGTL